MICRFGHEHPPHAVTVADRDPLDGYRSRGVVHLPCLHHDAIHSYVRAELERVSGFQDNRGSDEGAAGVSDLFEKEGADMICKRRHTFPPAQFRISTGNPNDRRRPYAIHCDTCDCPQVGGWKTRPAYWHR